MRGVTLPTNGTSTLSTAGSTANAVTQSSSSCSACTRSLSRALAIEGAMGRLILTAILLAIVTPAAAQTADRLYLMDCGHNSAKDQARWSPGVAKAARKYVAVTDRATHPHKPLRLTRLAVRSYSDFD